MTRSVHAGSWSAALAGRGTPVGLRVLVASGGLLAIVCTRAAADDPLVGLDAAVLFVAVLCAAFPDTHLGLVAVAFVGANWLATVDDVATPWAIGVGVAVAVLHTAMAAASATPASAPWTRAMRLRWTRRFAVVAAACAPAWLVTAAFDEAGIAGSPVLFTAALLIIAGGVLWARHGHLGVDPPS